MRFAENIIGLWIMSALVELLLMRLSSGRMFFWRTILIASVSSGISFLAIWVWIADVQFGWKIGHVWGTALEVFSVSVSVASFGVALAQFLPPSWALPTEKFLPNKCQMGLNMQIVPKFTARISTLR